MALKIGLINKRYLRSTAKLTVFPKALGMDDMYEYGCKYVDRIYEITFYSV